MLNMIPQLRLIRLEENYQYGTFGMLLINSTIYCATLEPRDWENEPDISSIPAKQYYLQQYSSQKYPETWQVIDVPGRSKILLHAGNTIHDTAGCILLGEYHTKLYLQAEGRMIANSGDTFRRFIDMMKGYTRLHLTIKEAY